MCIVFRRICGGCCAGYVVLRANLVIAFGISLGQAEQKGNPDHAAAAPHVCMYYMLQVL